MHRPQAVITVFFSLLCVVFLGAAFAVTEAVRLTGSHAFCADAVSLGNWSLFSEYENSLLEDYELFGVDGAYGGGHFDPDHLKTRLEVFLHENTDPGKGIGEKLPGITLDPWKVSLKGSRIVHYALLTDHSGEYFYQQAVEYMYKTGWVNALDKLRDAFSAKRTLEAESELSKDSKASAKEMAPYEKNLKEAKNNTSGSDPGSVVIIAQGEEAAELDRLEREGRKKNPLEKIDSLRRSDLLTLVCGQKPVSKQALKKGVLFSGRKKNKGSLQLDTPRGGYADNLLFWQYLLDHFINFTGKKKNTALHYQTEYLICGRLNDRANLKSVVRRLLLIREAMNYAVLVTDGPSNAEVQELALLIAGWSGSMVITQALKHALLLGWAFGESLFDVRVLLHEGRVPLYKTRADWNIPLSRLIDLEIELKRADRASEWSSGGLDYEDYLRFLISLTPVSRLKARALDMIELNLRQNKESSEFSIDNCVVGILTETQWDVRPVFSRVPLALLGTGQDPLSLRVEGGFSY